jgi:D-glycero-D-manno-heptose 1,7-bisphosphate phosphatase
MRSLVDGVGTWAWVADPATEYEQKPALFLDRDGVIVHEVDFLIRPTDVALIPGAAETIAAFNRAGIPVIVVTNQSGIARGHLSWADFESIETELATQLTDAAEAHLDAVFACGYHEAGEGPLGAHNHPWRKPNPGMLRAAADRLGVRLEESWIVGDRARDLETGRAAGLAGGIHVSTGHGNANERGASLALATSDFRVEVCETITMARQLCKHMVAQANR